MAGPEQLRIHLLGGFRVAVGKRGVEPSAWRLRAAAALVKLLALDPSHRLHREYLMDRLWPDADPTTAGKNLNYAVHIARRILDPAGTTSDYLRREGELLVLGPAGSVWVDVDAFEEAVARAWQAHDPAVQHAAVELYTGDLLPEDSYEDWVAGRRTALRASYLTLLARLAQLHENRDELGQAIDVQQQILSAEPTQEAAHVALMRLYARAGQRRQALAQYDQLVAMLERELDADPEPASRELVGAIRDGRYPDTIQPLEPPIATDSEQRETPTNLPAPVGKLIGRGREIAEVRQLLDTARLVTLTGPGGIGKTRLSLAVGRAALESFPDGVFFVSLAPVRTPELVLSTIAQTLGVRETRGQRLEESVRAFLADKRLLLILDNYEHVVAAAPVVADLLAACPRLAILVTSRVSLRLTGEHVFAVPPLALPDPQRPPAIERLRAYEAVALFVERAAEARTDFALTPANAGAVVGVCRRLDGLPLAIELAAARVKLLPPQTMVTRLETRLPLLTGGARDLPARQQTLRDTIAWSYDLLHDDEQKLYRRLSVFAGGWTLEAAEAVAGSRTSGDSSTSSGQRLGLDVLDGLGALVDHSLVRQNEQPDGTPRFDMLETIREYGLERLAEHGEIVEARERHARHFLSLAEQSRLELSGPGQQAWFSRLEVELGNVRAALGWSVEHDVEAALRSATDMWQFWLVHAHLSEGQRWLAAALASGTDASPSARAKALDADGGLTSWLGDYEHANRLFEESLSIAHRLGDRSMIATTLTGMGRNAMAAGDYERADALGRESVAIFRELGDTLGLARAVGNLGWNAMGLGDFARGEALLEESLALARELGFGTMVANYLTGLGFFALDQHDEARAISLFTESLAMHRDHADTRFVAMCFEGFGRVAVLRAQMERAARLFSAANRLRESIGIRPDIAPIYLKGRDLAAPRVALGDEAFAAAWAEGEAMPLDEAIAYALKTADQ